jgi:hypothetical protein
MPTALARKLALFVLANAAVGCFALFTLDGYDQPLPVGADASDDAGSTPTGDDGSVVTPPVADAGSGFDAALGPPKLIFVTSLEVSVGARPPEGFLGVADASSLCTLLANKNGLKGQFRAWLSDEQADPPGYPGVAEANVPPSTGPFVMLDNRLVALSYAELRDAGPRVAISVTETGVTLPEVLPPGNGAPPTPGTPCTQLDGLVWTGGPTTLGATIFAPECSRWAAPSPDLTGSVGSIVKDRLAWVWTCQLSCTSRARLYCFEASDVPAGTGK